MAPPSEEPTRKHGRQLMADINSGFYGLPGGDIRVNHGNDESHMVTFSIKKIGLTPGEFTTDKQEDLRHNYARCLLQCEPRNEWCRPKRTA